MSWSQVDKALTATRHACNVHTRSLLVGSDDAVRCNATSLSEYNQMCRRHWTNRKSLTKLISSLEHNWSFGVLFDLNNKLNAHPELTDLFDSFLLVFSENRLDIWGTWWWMNEREATEKWRNENIGKCFGKNEWKNVCSGEIFDRKSYGNKQTQKLFGSSWMLCFYCEMIAIML